MESEKTANARSDRPLPERALARYLELQTRVLSLQWLETLARRKGFLSQSMHEVPRSMHRVANQTELVLELIDDFRTGEYRDIAWHNVALLTAALLYTVSPADIIPDALPFLGALDDVTLVAVATRLVRNDLRAYCRFKGYDEDDYFRGEKEPRKKTADKKASRAKTTSAAEPAASSAN